MGHVDAAPTHTPEARVKGLLEKIARIRDQYDVAVEVQLGEVRLHFGLLRALEEAHATAYAQLNSSEKQKGMLLYYLKLGILALAIRKIDDLDLSALKPDQEVPGEKTGRFEFVIEILKSLPGDVVDHLYGVYTGMIAQSREAIGKTVQIPQIPKPPAVDLQKAEATQSQTPKEAEDEGSIGDVDIEQ